MTLPFRRTKADEAAEDAIAQSQVVGQILFVEAHEKAVTVDLVALSVRHPSGRTGPGAAFDLMLRMPDDPMWAALLARLLHRWAAENRVVGVDFGYSDHPVVTMRSNDCVLRLDLVDNVV